MMKMLWLQTERTILFLMNGNSHNFFYVREHTGVVYDSLMLTHFSTMAKIQVQQEEVKRKMKEGSRCSW